MQRIQHNVCFGGRQEVWSHTSALLGCTMRLGIYLPPQAQHSACPVLYWLSGLTCNEQNFITKGQAQRYAAQHGIIVVAPDTSPRGEHVADDPQRYDLGQGAGFYVNATEQPWAAHYQMHDYIVHELPQLIEQHFPATAARGISGHSMGGHGALVCALRNPGRYRSISAFSPIVAPSVVPWGQQALSAYLGPDPATWKDWDACQLIHSAKERLPLLIDQGDADEFLVSQLQPHLLRQACDAAQHPLQLRMQPGYDHSYYFIATWMQDHMAHHANALFGTSTI